MDIRTVTITKTVLVPVDAGKLLVSDDALLQFWSKVAVNEGDGCWTWLSYRINTGYGQYRVGLTKMLAHRIAYLDVVGEIPKGLVLRHKCNNPLCVKPDHLHTGTQMDNIHDAIRAGRFKRVDGSLGGKASSKARAAARAAALL